ncbi:MULTISPECIES: hypothetical protein [unclassified Dyella]|uniref:hypothetical protein n=1 Tax=unclassified Dyella TaxID=2634549 RepID=UPI000C82AA92|nr:MULTISPECIES: hypothetical protein [unclassified Dyella]MDR3444394.1 hypothetical protein [Dyella sp.]PMQ06023.1 hypothetical protein DyAD56_07165 [Dyella sp. AD56]
MNKAAHTSPARPPHHGSWHWRSEFLWPLGFLLLGFVLVTLRQTDYLQSIPGDMGDARFNNIILEHFYRWVIGKDSSLWSPEIFFPYPGTLTFSDNHFGTGPFYVVLRLIGLDPESAFASWYVLAAPLNFAACYYALRKMGVSAKGSAIGAFVYTFAFNVSARHGHAQLDYRFAIPLAILAWQRLFEEGRLKQLAVVAVWVTVQFYGSIYLGYFLLLTLLAYFVAMSIFPPASGRPYRTLLHSMCEGWRERNVAPVAVMAACFIALIALFYPYMHYSKMYGFGRTYDVIESMLPRPSSYFLADGSMIWGKLSDHIKRIPVRWEHQMFFGAAAYLLAILGVFRRPNRQTLTALVALLFLVVLTLDIHHHSIYVLLYKLPLANAIRAIARIGLVMVFPLALLVGSGVDSLVEAQRKRYVAIGAAVLIAVFMVAEYAAYFTVKVPIRDLRERLAAQLALVPKDLPKDAIIYIPNENSERPFDNEIDGMRLSQAIDRATLNGYSGNVPTGFNDPGIDACAIVNNRFIRYATFANASYESYASLVKRAVVIGGSAKCTPRDELPQRTHYSGKLPEEVVRNISLTISRLQVQNGQLMVTFELTNHSAAMLPSISDDGHPLGFSWRFVPVGETFAPYFAWDPRQEVTSDIPASGARRFDVPVQLPPHAGKYRLEANLVQEGLYWFSEHGMQVPHSSDIIEVGANGSVQLLPDQPQP